MVKCIFDKNEIQVRLLKELEGIGRAVYGGYLENN